MLRIDILLEFKYMYNAVDLAFTECSSLGACLVNAKHRDTKIFTAKSAPYFLCLQGAMILLIGFASLLQRGIFGVV